MISCSPYLWKTTIVWSVYRSTLPIVQCGGAIDLFQVSHSVVLVTECFLANPEWQDIFWSHNGISPCNVLHYKLLRHLPSFCNLFKMLGLLREYPSDYNREVVLHEALLLSQALQSMNPSIEAMLDDPAQVKSIDNVSSQPPVSLLYEASCIDLPRVCCYHAYFSLVVAAAIVWMRPQSADFREYHLLLGKRIWAFHRQAIDYGPLAFDFYCHALVMTYDQAESEETRDWIVALLNKAQRRQRSTDDMWTKDGIWLSDFVRTGSFGLSSLKL